MSRGHASKTVKYCNFPIEDGRCAKSFAVYSIRSNRKYCDEHMINNPDVPNPKISVTSNNLRKIAADDIAMRKWVKAQMGKENTSFARDESYTTGVAARVTKIEQSLSRLKQDFKVWDDVDKPSEYTMKKKTKILSAIDKTVERILNKDVDSSIVSRLNTKVASLNTKNLRLEKEVHKMKIINKARYTALSVKITRMKKKQNKGENKNDK